jgi:transcription initiation factor TFIIIB Brf1 subunit/transcription initiation factor TFIIB
MQVDQNCKECNVNLEEKNVCFNCGLVNDIEISHYSFSEPEMSRGKNFNKYSKIQNWNLYSNEENNEYKLVKHIKELCKILNIDESLIPEINVLVCKVTEAIKNNFDGSKRCKVKNGIIIMCIYNISKNNSNYNYSYIEMAKSINLETKYTTRADKIINELINCKKLKLPNEFISNFKKIDTPLMHIINVIKKYNIIIDENIINHVSQLIAICDDNDILSDHTPLSIGVGCFYYILNLHDISIDVKIFSKIYNLSIVTILKMFKQLKKHTKALEIRLR